MLFNCKREFPGPSVLSGNGGIYLIEPAAVRTCRTGLPAEIVIRHISGKRRMILDAAQTRNAPGDDASAIGPILEFQQRTVIIQHRCAVFR